MARPQVLSVASEVYPLIKTGGLADVAGALPTALKVEGVAVRTLVPGYPPVLKAMRRAASAHDFEDLFGGPARLLAGRAAGLDLFVLDAPHLFDRPGGPYVGADGREFADNAIRFAALARVGADLGRGLVPSFRPDVVHAHDWQAGLLAAYLTYEPGERPGVVQTIHNLAFQGQFDRRLLATLGLPTRAFSTDGVEYYGDIGYLKAGVRLADRITTVSPTYAAEICTPEGGMGLDGLLRGRADLLSGILNGIDTAVWNPANDRLISARPTMRDLTRHPRDGIRPIYRPNSASIQTRTRWCSASSAGSAGRRGWTCCWPRFPCCSAKVPSWPCSVRASRNLRLVSPPPPAPIPGASGSSSAMTRPRPTASRPAPTRCSCPPVSNPAGSPRCAPCAPASSRSSRGLAD